MILLGLIIDDSNYIEALVEYIIGLEIGLLNLILIKPSLLYLQETIMLIALMYILEIQTT